MKKFLFFSLLTVFICSCSPTTYKQISKTYPANNSDTITVYEYGQRLKNKYEVLGTIKLENSEFSKLGNYAKVVKYAKDEARKIGGNAIKIIEHTGPQSEMIGLGVAFTTTHDIVFKILKVSKSEPISINVTPRLNPNYTQIYFYEQKSGYAAYGKRTNLIQVVSSVLNDGYKIILDDSILVNIEKDWKKSVVRINKTGNHIIKAKIKDGIFKIPIYIQNGMEIYIRLRYSISGRRIFEIVDNEVGEFEYSLIE